MKLLVDANVSPVVCEKLKAAGFDASQVYDHDLGTASDEVIAALHKETRRPSSQPTATSRRT
ncbi:MAG: DUF5615 family PIN-like protein [Nocardioidaceae bacterium]|jgi:predicted nuclease of predicted toxin-antitoxin system|nr:DUF5615 family PIN-like protein [Nocardioidaceae bacterium]